MLVKKYCIVNVDYLYILIVLSAVYSKNHYICKKLKIEKVKSQRSWVSTE